MNAEDIIREVQENASEYLEMIENPDAFVSGILANKIVKLQSYIEYLERRINATEYYRMAEPKENKITASDAPIIMGVSPWKTPLQLYNEKISDEIETKSNQWMQRGLDLEPIARELFTIKTGIEVNPDVIIKDWQMASLDGISACKKYVLEIKCPGPVDHAAAVFGNIPDKYYPQLQHQMHVCDVDFMYYFSFDGIDGVIITLSKNTQYIEQMINAEWAFYQCIINKIPPDEDRKDLEWIKWAEEWKMITGQIKHLEEKEKLIREKLISLAGSSSAKGAGISLSQIHKKGLIDYSQIPELKNIDLEIYRKPSSTSWRITLN